MHVLQPLRQILKMAILSQIRTTPFTAQLIILQKPRVSTTAKFRKNGETEFKNYSPAQLKAYRSNNDDFYYFSKDIKIEDKQEKLFAGYLVKGGMSLYHFLVLGKDYYLLEGENGETAQILDASPGGWHEFIAESRIT